MKKPAYFSSSLQGRYGHERQGVGRYFAPICCWLAIAASAYPLQANSDADVSVTMSSQTISDGVSLANAKSISSAVIEYSTQVANKGAAPLLATGLVITNRVPQNLILYVGDMDGPGSGPVVFAQGVLPSQLVCIFGSIADGSDCLEFSNDGGATFDYHPAPDADGYDAAVTHIRIRPQGVMAPASVQPSSFVLRYRMKVT